MEWADSGMNTNLRPLWKIKEMTFCRILLNVQCDPGEGMLLRAKEENLLDIIAVPSNKHVVEKQKEKVLVCLQIKVEFWECF